VVPLSAGQKGGYDHLTPTVRDGTHSQFENALGGATFHIVTLIYEFLVPLRSYVSSQGAFKCLYTLTATEPDMF
jgi:hypothetical protein